MKSIKKKLKVYLKPQMIILAIIATIVLFLIYHSNYQLFHLMAEASGIILTALTGVITVKTYKYSHDNFLLFLGYNFIFITILDFINLITGSATGIIPQFTPEAQTFLMILSECLFALMLAAGPFFIRTKPPGTVFWGVCSALAGFFVIMILQPYNFIIRALVNFNPSFFTIMGGFLIIATLGLALFHYFKKRVHLSHSIYYTIMIYIGLNAFSGLRFIFYSNEPGIINFAAEISKIFAYLFVFHVVLILGIDNLFDSIKELKECAIHDQLTGLFNRKGLLELARKEIARVRREGVTMGVLLMDVDRFKSVNDRHGHLIGDQVLKKFADILRNVVRESDLICRLGGDEFVLIMKGNLKDLHLVRFRILEAVDRWRATDKIARKIGVSIGCALWNPDIPVQDDIDQLDHLLDIADQEMYREKMRKRSLGKTRKEAQLQIFHFS